MYFPNSDPRQSGSLSLPWALRSPFADVNTPSTNNGFLLKWCFSRETTANNYRLTRYLS